MVDAELKLTHPNGVLANASVLLAFAIGALILSAVAFFKVPGEWAALFPTVVAAVCIILALRMLGRLKKRLESFES